MISTMPPETETTAGGEQTADDPATSDQSRAEESTGQGRADTADEAQLNSRLRDDCFLHDSDRLTHLEALGLLRQRVVPVMDVVNVAIEDATGRVLAENVTSPRNIPAHTNAAVDGFAFAFGDYDPEAGSTLQIGGRIAAGRPPDAPIGSGSAARIFTGAAIPEPLDTVVMQEDAEIESRNGTAWVRIPAGLKPGANRRLAGEDVKEGAVLLTAGNRLRPQDLAIAAAAGRPRLACRVPLRVAVYSTGDEVVRPGAELGPGEVYDANAPMLRGLIEACGAECVDLGILPDSVDAVQASLQSAAAVYDVVITSGGASRGEEDHVVEVVNRVGKLHMWQIAVKPGRPMAFGQIGDAPFMGLPGNPVAVFVCFLLYVRPVLMRLAGCIWPEPTRYPLRAAFAVPSKKTGRREFWRGFLTTGQDGELAADKFPRDGSGLITGLCAADGLIEVVEDIEKVDEGDIVNFIPFAEFGIRRV